MKKIVIIFSFLILLVIVGCKNDDLGSAHSCLINPDQYGAMKSCKEYSKNYYTAESARSDCSSYHQGGTMYFHEDEDGKGGAISKEEHTGYTIYNY